MKVKNNSVEETTINPVLEFNTYLPSIGDGVIEHLAKLDMVPTEKSLILIRGGQLHNYIGNNYYLKVTMYGGDLLGSYDLDVIKLSDTNNVKNTINYDDILLAASKEELLLVIANMIDRLIKDAEIGVLEMPEPTVEPDFITLYLKDGAARDFSHIREFYETDNTLTFKSGTSATNTITFFKSALAGYQLQSGIVNK